MEAIFTKSIYWKAIDLHNFLKSILLRVRLFLFAISYPKTVELAYVESLVPFKQEIFADINSIIPSNKNEQIRILEIGIGPGKR